MRVLVLSITGSVASDPRLSRCVDFLRPDHEIVLASPDASEGGSGTEHVTLSAEREFPLRRRAEAATRAALRNAGEYARAYWLDRRMRRWRDELRRALPVDAILIGDPLALPLVSAVGPVPVIFDAQEHWTSESASWSRWQRLSMRDYHEWLVDRFVPRTATMMSVSPGIARDFESRTGVRPRLVTNAPPFQELAPSEVTHPIRLLHAGVADERRRLEGMIEAVRSLDERFTLDMLLVRENDYRRRLERLVASEPRIRILQPVPHDEVVTFANGYDVGIYLFHADYPNAEHSLPNKIFEFIQARLAIAIGPSPAMAEVVREWDCGVISDSFDPDSFATTLGALTVEEVGRLKGNADRAAHVLTAEGNRKIVRALVDEATGRNGAAP